MLCAELLCWQISMFEPILVFANIDSAQLIKLQPEWIPMNVE